MSLKITDYILLLLYCGWELLDTEPGAFFYPYKALYGYTKEWERGSIRGCLSRLKRQKLIERRVIKGEICFRITDGGRDKVAKIIPVRGLREHRWDGLWRLVVFDVPEKKRWLRDDLRDKLLELGFACWQRSVWVTPFDVGREVSEYLESANLSQYSPTLLVKRMYGINEKDFAYRVWRLDKLEGRYREIIERGRRINVKKKDAGRRLNNSKELILDYWDLLTKDPALPYDLLPRGWRKMERAAKREIVRASKIVRSC